MDEGFKKIRFVLILVLVLNWGVALAKLIVGYLTGSLSMIADGFHSFSDGASNIVGLVGIYIASRPKDADHPYGHKKIENFTALGIAMLLILVCFEVLQGAVARFRNPSIPDVNYISFAVMFVTMVVNYFVMRYEHGQGHALKSDVLVSDSLHTRSDIYTSLSVIISLVSIRLGYPLVDIIAAFMIVGFIGYAAYTILNSVSKTLTDSARLDENELAKLVTGIEGVHGCHKIRSRGREDDIYVDLHVSVKKDMKTEEAHALSHKIGAEIKKKFPGVTDVIAHIEPCR